MFKRVTAEAKEKTKNKMKEELVYYQFFLECSSFARFTPNILVTSALNSNVDEFRIWVKLHRINLHFKFKLLFAYNKQVQLPNYMY